jgi:hypothetical protein
VAAVSWFGVFRLDGGWTHLLAWAAISLGLASALAVGVTAIWHGASASVAAAGLARWACLKAIGTGVAVYDPCAPRRARTAPDGDAPPGPDFVPVETALAPGRSVSTAAGRVIRADAVRNERVARTRYAFCYQPYDEPRLHELRRKYRLEEVAGPAPDEFGAMVRLRGWARGRFRRSDYQPRTANFDALAVLDRDLRGRGEPYDPAGHLDPCQLFPLLYSQVLLSLGHQARLVSARHGMVEVWSNQYRKWVLMDAELDHHFEKAGVPLNMVEVLEENFTGEPPAARLVRGRRAAGAENPTLVHLGHEELPVAATVAWFAQPLELVDLRNDWLTNHYFRGHPARTDGNSLVFRHPRVTQPLSLAQSLRPRTDRADEFYWTLNQTEIHAHPAVGDRLRLAFRTVTPNFAHYEVVVDGETVTRSAAPDFLWRLHPGVNTLAVRPVNQFGVRGVESSVRLSVADAGQPLPPRTAALTTS